MSQQNKTELIISAVDRASATLTQIGARMSNLVKPASDLKRSLGGLSDASGFTSVVTGIGKIGKSIPAAARAIAGIAGVASGAVGSIALLATSAVDAADRIGDLSAKYQIHSDLIHVYGNLVEEAGGSFEDAAVGMGKLKKAMNEAIHGGKSQAAAFAGIGISVASLRKMSPEQVMEKMADAFKGSDKDLAKQSVLLELMGKNGTVFMDVLNQGSESYRQRLAEMRADGMLFTESQLQQADGYDKSWKRLQRTLAATKESLGLRLANALEPVVKAGQKWMVVNQGLIDQKFDRFLEKLPGILEAAKNMAIGLFSGVEKLMVVFSGLSSVLGSGNVLLLLLTIAVSPAIVAFGGLAVAVFSFVVKLGMVSGAIPFLISTLSMLWGVMLANPVGLLVAAVAGLAVIVYRNWDGIVQYVSRAWGRIKAVFGVDFFDGLLQLWMESWQTFANGVIGIIRTLMPDSWMPDAMRKFNVTFATERAQNVTAAAAAQTRNNQEVRNTIRLEIDAEGRTKVKELRSGSPATTLDVATGLTMAGV